ncbi:hypothetical protein ACFLXY_06640 [Chloroflexota bacterium]
MRKFVILFIMIIFTLSIEGTALAASLGVSPSNIEVEVPADGSSQIDLQVHFYKGDVQVSLVDIPLRIEPEIFQVDALEEPEDINLTIYGDKSLGSQVYEGYIRFMGVSNEMIAIAVKIRGTITHIVEGEPLPEIKEKIIIQENEENATELIGEKDVDSTTTAQEGTDITATEQENFIGSMSLNTVILIAAGVIFLGLVILAVSMILRRRY